jgi:hypothetical protein
VRVLDISQFENSFVIHFATEDKQINAYTLASTLVGLADAAKAANASVNPGHNIEIVVEALGEGSFRAKISAVYTAAGNLFSKQALQAIVLSIIASFIYERTLAVHHDVTIEIKTDEVIIARGDERVIIPRNVYDAARSAEANPQFIGAIGRTMESISKDEKVTGVAIVQNVHSPQPEVMIPREALQQIAPTIREEGNQRVVEEDCDLQIVKALLVRSDRKWEFRWRGVKISAPVLDPGFYDEFFAHRITIAPGDEFKARLVIRQTRDEDTGIYANVGYEVVQVYRHIPRVQQMQMHDNPEQ